MEKTNPQPHKNSLRPLEKRVLADIRRHHLIVPGARGMVSVSGGPDSMALLHILHALGGVLELAALEVVHFDHGLRSESASEADWVSREAARLERPAHIVRTGHLAGLSSGVQAAAREWRREESARLMAQWEAQWTATGHQREDNLETWLMKLLRGAHLSHLGGMAWRNGPFIRPLLKIPRADLTAYLKDKGQQWLEDPTNLLPRYKRNRVRHELLPLLADLTGAHSPETAATDGKRPLDALERRLDALERQARKLEEWLAKVQSEHPVAQNDPTEGVHWISAPELAALPELAASDALHRFITARMPGLVPFGQMERATALLKDGKPRWRLHLPGLRLLRRHGERILLERRPGPNKPSETPNETVCLEVLGLRVWKPEAWRVNLFHAAPGMEAAEDTNPGAVDREVSGLPLYNLPPHATLEIRPRRPGDRFQPPWKDKPVKLKDFLRDRKIPLSERDRVALVLLDKIVIGVLPSAKISAKNSVKKSDGPGQDAAGPVAARGYHEPKGESPALWVGVEVVEG